MAKERSGVCTCLRAFATEFANTQIYAWVSTQQAYRCVTERLRCHSGNRDTPGGLYKLPDVGRYVNRETPDACVREKKPRAVKPNEPAVPCKIANLCRKGQLTELTGMRK